MGGVALGWRLLMGRQLVTQDHMRFLNQAAASTMPGVFFCKHTKHSGRTVEQPRMGCAKVTGTVVKTASPNVLVRLHECLCMFATLLLAGAQSSRF